MKKYLSVLLVLTMILSMVIPMGAFAEGNENQAIFDKLHEKFGGVTTDTSLLIKAVEKLSDTDFYNTVLNDAETVINGSQYSGLKSELNGSLYLTKDNVNGEVGIVKDWLSSTGELTKLIDDVKKGSASQVSLGYIGTLRSSLLGSDLAKAWENKGVLQQGKSKINFVLDIYDAILDNLTVKEKDSSMNLEFNINVSGLSSRIKAIQSEYLNGNKITDTSKAASAVSDAAKLAANDFNNKIGNSEVAKSLFKQLVNYVSYTAPSDEGSSGSSGGSSNSDADVPVTQPGKVDKEESAVEFGKDNVSVQTKDGVSTVTLKEYDLVAGIKNLRKSIGSDKEGKAVVDIENVEGVNVSFVLSSKIAEALSDNNISLEINAGDIQYLISSDALKGIEIPSGAKIQFKSAEGDVESIAAAAGELGNAKKVVELSLEITSGKDTAKVSEFASPVTVTVNVKGLGDKDKLAVYYFNEEEGKLEFVTGKIKDDKAVLVLSHYSKYAFLESTKSFTDLEGHWAKDYIESMAAKNAVNGYEDGTFKPEEKVTRAQFVKMFVSSLEEKLEAYDGSFTDVAEGDWFAPYVATAKKLGIASGYADGSFKPNKEISRTEMAVMLSSLTDEELTEEDVAKELTVFADADSIPSWAREAVAEVVKAGLMNGDNGSFNPENPATRAEAATVIYRAYNK